MIKVRVRGGYDFPYRNSLYKSGSEFEMEEGEYRGLAHLFDVVPEPVVQKEVVVEPEPIVVEPEVEPEVETAAMEEPEVANRAILKPTRTRSRK